MRVLFPLVTHGRSFFLGRNGNVYLNKNTFTFFYLTVNYIIAVGGFVIIGYGTNFVT